MKILTFKAIALLFLYSPIISYDFICYDFNKFIFPEFYVLEFPLPIVGEESEDLRRSEEGYLLLRTLNFWYKGELLSFQYTPVFLGAVFRCRSSFRGVVFRGEVLFGGTRFHNVADFREVIFKGQAVFEEAIFKDRATFWKAHFQDEANFESTTFGDEAVFSEVTFKGKTVFKRASFQSKVYFEGANFQNEANFERATFKGKVLLNLTEESLPTIFNLSNIKLSEDSYIEIRNLRTTKLILDGVNNVADNFLFFDTKIVKFEDLQENQRENLNEKGFRPNIEIRNSILNNMKLINCDFSEAEQIEIENSSLTKVELLNTDWGKISEKRICPELFEESPEKARDVYRQLKLALDNQKDYINANEFYSLEMKAYEKVLRKRLSPLQKKLVFLIHKFASNFGQSWFKPLLLLILLTVGEMGAQLDSSSFWSKFFYFLKPYILIALFLSLLLAIFEERKNFSTFKEQFSVFLTCFLYVCLWGISVIFALSGFIVFKKFFFNPESWQLSLKVFLEEFAQTLNIFNFFKSSQVPSEKFLHTLYSIAVTFLTYQMIVAIRRQVRR